MTTMNNPAFVNALSLDWKVGYQLWRNLNDELKRQLQDVRDRGSLTYPKIQKKSAVPEKKKV